MNPREREVRGCATDLLAHLSVTTVPVDPVRIARRQGLAVEEGPLPSGVYGALWKKGNRFGIIVSDACPTPGHRRFSLAHELGHYHIDGHLDAMFAGDAERVESAGGFLHDGKSRLEREADWFASELLVPASELGPGAVRRRDAVCGRARPRVVRRRVPASRSRGRRGRDGELRAGADVAGGAGHLRWPLPCKLHGRQHLRRRLLYAASCFGATLTKSDYRQDSGEGIPRLKRTLRSVPARPFVSP